MFGILCCMANIPCYNRPLVRIVNTSSDRNARITGNEAFVERKPGCHDGLSIKTVNRTVGRKFNYHRSAIAGSSKALKL